MHRHQWPDPSELLDFNSNFTRQNNANAGGTGVGSTFATFLLDMPSGGNVPRNASAFYSQHYTAGFFQDDWRVTNKLTLNLGLRVSLFGTYRERYQSAFSFAPAAFSTGAEPGIFNDPTNPDNPLNGSLAGGNPFNGIIQCGGMRYAIGPLKAFGELLNSLN